MQVEVKLRLPNKEAHQQLQQLLLPGKVATHQQVSSRHHQIATWNISSREQHTYVVREHSYMLFVPGPLLALQDSCPYRCPVTVDSSCLHLYRDLLEL